MVSTLSYSADELSLLMLSPAPLLEPLPFVQATASATTSTTPTQPRYRRRRVVTMAMLLPSGAGGVDQPTCTDDARCRYPSKLCGSTRVRKASGALHRYCAYHRDKANANQKRWVGRQRDTTESSVHCAESPSPTSSSSSMASSPASSTASSPTCESTYRWVDAAKTIAEPLTASSASAATLSDDDWDSLFSLLASPAPLTSGASPTSPGSYNRHRAMTARSHARYTPFN